MSAADNNIQGALAENILTLLCFDDDAAGIIVNSVDVGLFESDIYKNIAQQVVAYYTKFKEAPKEHLADLLEEHLEDQKDTRKADLYQKILLNLYEFKDSINKKYVLDEVRTFVRQQKLKSGIVDATTYVREGELDKAENVLTGCLNSQIDLFEPGIFFADTTQSLRFFDDIVPTYQTGIKPLDEMRFGPAPGELLVVLAPANRGKTWFMIHLGKFCVMQHLKVLHVSLEMSEEKMTQRYMQTFFSFSKRKGENPYRSIKRDEMGRYIDTQPEMIERPSLDDHDAEMALAKRVDRVKNRLKLWVKRFPTNALTIQGLEAYLDALDRFEHYHPDVIIVDYADLMKLDSSNIRVDTGNVYKDLRRIGVERNCAMISASQSNRLGEDAKVITLKHLAEDYSKAATADNIIAYCQTSQEQRYGLARLFIAKARDEEREQSVIITQNYRIGQFCMDANRMDNRYWDTLEMLPTDGSDKESTGDRNRVIEGTTDEDDTKALTHEEEEEKPARPKRRKFNADETKARQKRIREQKESDK